MPEPSFAYVVSSIAILFGLASAGLAMRFRRDSALAAARLTALRSETALARDLVDLTSDAVLVVDTELRIIRANKVYLLLNGVPSADLAGEPLSGSQGKHPELNEYLQTMLLQMQQDLPGADAAPLVGTLVLKASDDSERTFEVRARPYRPAGGTQRGTVIALTDITDKLAAEALVDQAAAAMDDITSALSLTFAQMRREPTGHVWVPWVKGMASPYWDWSAGDLLRDGGGIFPNLVGDEKSRFVDAITQSMAGNTPIDIVLFLKPHNRWVRIGTGKPHAGDHDTTIWYCYAMDVTEEQRHTALLATARRQAEAAAEAKSRFLATMSHEVRTPLATVIASLELLRDGALSARQSEELDLADHSARMLLEMLGDILDFSRIESGRLKLERMPVDLRAIVEDVLRVLERQIAAKGLSIEFHADAGVAARLMGDAVRLRQILLNLVGNAAKFTARGGIKVRLVLEADHGDAQEIRIDVEDTGIGVPEDQQATLFDPFVQADISTTRQYGGSGLGLSICSRLVQAMGGAISLSSTPGIGSTFRVKLTMQTAERAAMPEPDTAGRAGALVQAAEAVSPTDRTALPILVVEDHAPYQIVLRWQIEKLGFVCDVVSDGKAALDALRQKRYGMVLTDCHMPNMDGYDLTSEIRASEAGGAGHVPVVALSADETEEHKLRARAVGMDDLLLKPIRLPELRDCIERWMRHADVVEAGKFPSINAE